MRRELWGYSPEERLTNEQLIAEQYRGIRPAPGYPACPDHTEKGTLWQMLDVERAIDLRITESYAMYPTAAVSGWYFAHPDAKYFAVGPIDLDQMQHYAARKGWSAAEARKWLVSNLEARVCRIRTTRRRRRGGAGKGIPGEAERASVNAANVSLLLPGFPSRHHLSLLVDQPQPGDA